MCEGRNGDGGWHNIWNVSSSFCVTDHLVDVSWSLKLLHSTPFVPSFQTLLPCEVPQSEAPSAALGMSFSKWHRFLCQCPLLLVSQLLAGSWVSHVLAAEASCCQMCSVVVQLSEESIF